VGLPEENHRMHSRAWLRGIASLVGLAAAGCTALRDIPRDQFGTRDERKDVRVETRDGLVYEFDYVRVHADSLVGYRRSDLEGSVEDFVTVPMPLDDVTRMSARGVDWKRTSLIGGGALAAVVAAGLAVGTHGTNGSSSSGGGKGGGVP
jgi:hypothetical protein